MEDTTIALGVKKRRREDKEQPLGPHIAVTECWWKKKADKRHELSLDDITLIGSTLISKNNETVYVRLISKPSVRHIAKDYKGVKFEKASEYVSKYGMTHGMLYKDTNLLLLPSDARFDPVLIDPMVKWILDHNISKQTRPDDIISMMLSSSTQPEIFGNWIVRFGDA